MAYGYSTKILADETAPERANDSILDTAEKTVVDKRIGGHLHISIDPNTGAILPADQTSLTETPLTSESRSADVSERSTEKQPQPHPLQSYRVTELPGGGRMYELTPNSEGHYDAHLKAQYSVSIQGSSGDIKANCAIKNHGDHSDEVHHVP